MAKLTVNNNEITLITERDQDFISLTDMANAKNGESRAADIIKNWIRARYTLEFIGTWEIINNPNFKVVEFDHFKLQVRLSQKERLIKLNEIAIKQMQLLNGLKNNYLLNNNS